MSGTLATAWPSSFFDYLRYLTCLSGILHNTGRGSFTALCDTCASRPKYWSTGMPNDVDKRIRKPLVIKASHSPTDCRSRGRESPLVSRKLKYCYNSQLDVTLADLIYEDQVSNLLPCVLTSLPFEQSRGSNRAFEALKQH
jgi:hypothetical protein